VEFSPKFSPEKNVQKIGPWVQKLHTWSVHELQRQSFKNYNATSSLVR
jgi:hypothetical protein